MCWSFSSPSVSEAHSLSSVWASEKASSLHTQPPTWYTLTLILVWRSSQNYWIQSVSHSSSWSPAPWSVVMMTDTNTNKLRSSSSLTCSIGQRSYVKTFRMYTKILNTFGRAMKYMTFSDFSKISNEWENKIMILLLHLWTVQRPQSFNSAIQKKATYPASEFLILMLIPIFFVLGRQ